MSLDVAMYIEEPQEWALPMKHLSPSSISKFRRCPEVFRQEYILNRPSRSGESLVIGTAVHSTFERNFRLKIKSGEDLPADDVLQWYEDEGFPKSLHEHAERSEGEIEWDTNPDGARLRGRAIASLYRETVAPRIQPLAVEERVESDYGLPVPVIGYIDVRCEHNVVDLKTSKKAAYELKPQWKIQGGFYCAATDLPVEFHVVSATMKEHAASVKTPLELPELSLWLAVDARAQLERTIRDSGLRMNHLMQTLGPDEVWPTDGWDHPWACGYCAFRPNCPAWKGQINE